MQKISLISYSWNVYSIEEEKRTMNFHEHNTIELSYVVSGVLAFYYIDQETGEKMSVDVNQDQLLIILPNVIHKTEIPYSLSCIGVEVAETNGDLRGYFKDSFFRTFLKKGKMTFKNGFLILNGSRKMLNHIKEMEGFAGKGEEDEIEMAKFDLLAKQLFVSIWEANSVKPVTDQSPFYRKAVLYIEENYHQNIKVDDVVAVTRASKSYLQQLFKEYDGCGIKKYIDRLRVHKAEDILKETSYSVEEISKIVGFNSTQVFLTNFKEELGLTPKGYRKKSLDAQKKRYFKANGSYREKKYR